MTKAKWPISERAEGIENPRVPRSKRFQDNIDAEARLKKWNAELADKRKS
jgi:hypothetical protein